MGLLVMIKRTIFWVKNMPAQYLEMLTKYWQTPLIISVMIIVLHVILTMTTDVVANKFYQQGLKISMIAMLTWAAIQAVRMTRDIIVSRSLQGGGNNLDVQRINTQVSILVKIIVRVLLVVGISSVLITFPQIRELGISILASAGIAGVIFGFAAQKSLGSVLAGVQIAFTQPIKIGDEIVVEHESGVVEEINLTYVVMRTVDKRHFVIPINYFIDHIFQNWTRNSSELVGVVYIEVDYTAPVNKIREELDIILQETDLWDGRIKSLQVSNAKSQTIELRILVSACNPAAAWNLRCYVREKIITFLQNNYPQCLPKMRLELKQVV